MRDRAKQLESQRDEVPTHAIHLPVVLFICSTDCQNGLDWTLPYDSHTIPHDAQMSAHHMSLLLAFSRPVQIRSRVHVVEGQRDALQSKVFDAEGKFVRETLRADCAEQELDSEKRLREGVNQLVLLLEQEKMALQGRAHAPPQLLPQQPSASSAAGSASSQLAHVGGGGNGGGGNLGASAMDNLMLAMASNAQTIQTLVGSRQAGCTQP